jgi:small subunit ribosomal protein S4
MQLKSKEKKERSLGEHLHLKGERCSSPKCVMVRRPYPPGQNGKKRKRAPSEFGTQLKEKQKLKWSYFLKENQIQSVFKEADRSKVATGEKMIELLERRLDNVVYRLGLTLSRIVARQIIKDGHIMVNGRKVTIPSYDVRIGDVIGIRPESKNRGVFKKLEENLKKYDAPTWLQLDKTTREGKMVALPFDTKVPFDIDLVIEYLSKYE